MSRFTEDELAIAKTVDLVAVAEHLGFTPKKVGRFYTLKEMDSIRIYDRRNWFRWSMRDVKGHNGGSQIDFLKEFAGMDVKTAVFWLLDFGGFRHSDTKCISDSVEKIKAAENGKDKKREFILPTPAESNRYLYKYLNSKRGISISTIDYFVNHGLIYESNDYHNIVFKGNDCNGITRFASLRGISDEFCKKPFKGDVPGSDKNYGFNVSNDDSDIVVVFEGAIDLMSYIDIFQSYETNKLALGMVCDNPLERFLEEHPGITTIMLCLDNDIPGRIATEQIVKKYSERGYTVHDVPPPASYKDINEWLVSTKISMTMVSERQFKYRK